MKKTVTLMIALLIAIAPLALVNAQQSSDNESMSMGMMNEAKMEKMQKHISEMNTLLGQVRKETNQEKREEMLLKHAQSMGDMMSMMHGEHKGQESSMTKDNMKAMKEEKQISDEQRIEMMENRIALIEEMMGQMVGYTTEKSKPLHKHKIN